MKNLIDIDQVTAALAEIRAFNDLRDFQLDHGPNFCEKWKISPKDLLFLINVVSHERIKDEGILTKKILPPEKDFIKTTVDMILETEANFNNPILNRLTPGDIIADFVLSVYARHEKWWVKQYQTRIYNMLHHDELMEAKIKQTMKGWPKEPATKRKKITAKSKTK